MQVVGYVRITDIWYSYLDRIAEQERKTVFRIIEQARDRHYADTDPEASKSDRIRECLRREFPMLPPWEAEPRKPRSANNHGKITLHLGNNLFLFADAARAKNKSTKEYVEWVLKTYAEQKLKS